MSGRVRFWILSGFSIALISASWIFFLSLWNDVYWRDERYSLVAIDRLSQMNLSFNDDGYYSVLVGPVVYSLGADEKHIVLKQHPPKENPEGFDREVTDYFIIDRTLSSSLEDRQRGVRGPLTKDQFEKQAAALSLPRFSKTFRELE